MAEGSLLMNTDINRPLFYSLCCDSAIKEHKRYNIGTYKEKRLHIILKHYFEADTAYHEIPYNGFIADIKRDDSIVEIETNGFSGLSPKLAAFLPTCRVNLVYPIPHIKYVAWVDPVTGDISPKKKSPKKAGVYDAVFEMVRILDYVSDPNLTVTAMLLSMDEYRLLDGWSRDRKRGSHRAERMPTDICDILQLRTNADYAAILPEFSQDTFTAAEFAAAVGIGTRYIYGILKVLCARGVIALVGKRGRSKLYSVNPTEAH